MTFKFEITKKSSKSKARLGKITTAHGEFNTPIFMPVGTQATVKALSPRDLDDLEVEAILANTYHLHLRPGEKVIKELGGLHKYMQFPRPIITDSGGYQVFSLGHLRKISDEKIVFQSHIDGATLTLDPEKVVDIQIELGSDIIMPLDHCIEHLAETKDVEAALERTTRWLKRSKDHLNKRRNELDEKSVPTLFGIVQGGMSPELRVRSANELMEIDMPGYSIGGVSVGEPQALMHEMIEVCCGVLPEEKPRYVMGLGSGEDLIRAIKEGADMFDSVLPTRLARHGTFFSPEGDLHIKNTRFIADPKPLNEGCACYTCRNFSRSYVRHLVMAKEILGMYLMSYHNVYYLIKLIQREREKIKKEES